MARDSLRTLSQEFFSITGSRAVHPRPRAHGEQVKAQGAPFVRS
ncbi:MAG TPA: hypothetical protein VK361_05815 [Rubrobacteraceae bacterium]|nr:hypothetical protein [Rubrobacteraceae bacterium]